MMGVLAAVLQLVFTAVLLIKEFNRRSVALFFWGMVFIVFCVPHLLSVATGNYLYSSQTMMIASCFVILFDLCYFVCRGLRLQREACDDGVAALDVACEKYSLSMRELVTIFAVMTVTASLLIFSARSFGGILNTSWGSIYEATSERSSFLLFLAPYVFACAGGAIIVLSRSGKYAALVLLVLLCGVYLLITKNRVVMLAMVCPFCLMLTARYSRLSLGQMIKYSLVVCLIIYFVYAILVFRHAGSVEAFLSSYSFSMFNERIFSYILSGEGELGLRNIFYYFIEHHNQFDGFSHGASYIRILLFWLPGGLSGGLKPDDFAITMASAYMGNPYNQIYSVHPTFFGDAYANFGFLGFLLAPFWAIVFNWLDTWIRKLDMKIKPYIVSACSYALILIGRGSIYNGAVIAIVAIVFLLLPLFQKQENPHEDRRLLQ